MSTPKIFKSSDDLSADINNHQIKSKKVTFHNKVKVINIHNYMIDSLNTNSNEEHTIINKDPTDIIDKDEQEILEDSNEIYNSEENYEHINLIKYLFNTFLEKFPHLNNYKNKNIIYSMFKIAITNMPEYIDKPIFYLNFVESSILQLTQRNYDDIYKE
jgi:hypothetical protein